MPREPFLRARDNPFAVDRLERIRYRLSGITWKQILARLREMRFRAALVGPEGAGKTTLLEDLHGRLASDGRTVLHLCITPDRPLSWPHICRSLDAAPFEILLFDGADHLSRLTWRRLKRRVFAANRGLIITSHTPGLLETLLDCRTSPELLQGIVADLAPSVAADRPLLDQLYRKHHGNIRNILAELYDRAANSSA